jgi:hypothetical protein
MLTISGSGFLAATPAPVLWCGYEEWRYIPEDAILHSDRRENLKSKLGVVV